MKETGVIFHTIHYSFHMRQSPNSLQLFSCILGIFAQDRLFWTMSGTEQYGITKKKKKSVCWREQCQEKNIFTKKKGGGVRWATSLNHFLLPSCNLNAHKIKL